MGTKKDGSPQARHGAGTCWQEPDGLWRCRVQHHGHRVYGRGPSERAARAAMNKAVREHQRTGNVPNPRLTPATIGAIGPLWLDGLRFTAKAPGTLAGYRSLYRTWVGPLPDDERRTVTPPRVDISKAPLASFGPDQRRAWWSAMHRQGASRAVIRNADTMLTGLLRAHKKMCHPDVLDRDAIERPRIDRAQRRRPVGAEMLRLLEHCTVDGQPGSARREPYATILELKVYCAARVGELRGLHWGDIDEIRGGLSIRVQMDRFTKAPRDTKGHAARYVPLDPEAMAILATHKRRQRERGLPTGPGDPVFLFRFFASRPPGIVSYNAIREAFHKARRAAKLPDDLTPHALRHGSAMLSLRTGTDLVTLQRKLGHKDLTTTALYLEGDGQLAQDDASRVARALRGDIGVVRDTG